jgi:hypothetical protein
MEGGGYDKEGEFSFNRITACLHILFRSSYFQLIDSNTSF